MKFHFRALVLVFLVSLLGCASSVSTEKGPLRIIILHSNDIHGNAWAFTQDRKLWVGGYSAQAALVKKIRKEAEEKGAVFFLLSAGDVNTGVPESDLSGAEPDFLAMEEIGYDAMVLGNHEFDHGLELIQRQQSWVSFPFLSANIRKKTGGLLVKPSLILQRKGIKFGILGLTTDHLKSLVLPHHVETLEVQDVIGSAKQGVAELKNDGAQFLIALTHIGLSGTGINTQRLIPNDDRKLAESIPNFQVIVGGHSHTDLPEGVRVGNTLIVQAGYKGVHLGRVDILWDTEERKVLESRAQLLEVNPQNGEDLALKEKLSKFFNKYASTLGQVIAEARTDLIGERNKSKTQEIPLGNLICDALMASNPVEIVLFNSGGIRTSIPQGPIQVRDVLQAFPFKNTVETATLSGAEIKKVLNEGVAYGLMGSGLLQVSGLRYEIRSGKVTRVWIGKSPLDPKRDYRLATNSYVLAGGDKLETMKQARNITHTGETVDEQLIRFLKQQKNVNPKVTGRILVTP